jgi:hypothetical protein
MAALDGFMITQVVVAAARLGIVRAIFERPRTTTELASIAEMHTHQIARLLTALEEIGLAVRDRVDHVEGRSLSSAARLSDGGSIESVLAYAELIDTVHYPAWSRPFGRLWTRSPRSASRSLG